MQGKDTAQRGTTSMYDTTMRCKASTLVGTAVPEKTPNLETGIMSASVFGKPDAGRLGSRDNSSVGERSVVHESEARRFLS